MLVGAVGVAATVAVYTVLLSILMAPIENAAGASVGPNVYPGAGHYIGWLAPALALLIGAVLAFVARRRSGS